MPYYSPFVGSMFTRNIAPYKPEQASRQSRGVPLDGVRSSFQTVGSRLIQYYYLSLRFHVPKWRELLV